MIFGHQKNIRIFSQYLKEKRFPHAVLFSGPERIGKRKMALEIAKYLEGNHPESFVEFSQKECSCRICGCIERDQFPDILEIKEEQGQISIQKIREIRKKLSLSSPYPFKIVIINKAHTLSEEATGALLKTLEEPRGNTIFFLLTSMFNILPQTILSRVEIFRFSLLSKEEIKDFLKNFSLSEPEKEKIAEFSLGRPGVAKEMAIDRNKILYYNSLLETIRNVKRLSIFERLKTAEEVKRRNETDDFLSLSNFWFRDLLFAKNGISQFSFSFKKEEIRKESENFSKERLKGIIKEIQKTKIYLLFSNVNQLLALENLLLKW